jgi:hypothetical protein
MGWGRCYELRIAADEPRENALLHP